MSKKRYASHVQVVLGGYENLAMPDQLDEIVILRYYVDGPVDRESLVDDIEDVLRETHQAFVLDDRWNHFSWGAESAFIEIVVAVSTAVASLGAILNVLDRIIRRRAKKGKPEEPPSADETAERARRAVANLKEVDASQVSVSEVEPVPGGFRTTLKVGSTTFTVETDQRHAVYRIKRV